MLAQAIVKILRDSALLPFADLQNLRLQPSPLGYVRGNSSDGINFPLPIKKREPRDDIGARTVVMKGHFVKHHRHPRLHHLQVVGPKRRRLLRGKNLGVCLADSLVEREVEHLLELPVEMHVAALTVL